MEHINLCVVSVENLNAEENEEKQQGGENQKEQDDKARSFRLPQKEVR